MHTNSNTLILCKRQETRHDNLSNGEGRGGRERDREKEIEGKRGGGRMRWRGPMKLTNASIAGIALLPPVMNEEI